MTEAETELTNWIDGNVPASLQRTLWRLIRNRDAGPSSSPSVDTSEEPPTEPSDDWWQLDQAVLDARAANRPENQIARLERIRDSLSSASPPPASSDVSPTHPVRGRLVMQVGTHCPKCGAAYVAGEAITIVGDAVCHEECPVSPTQRAVDELERWNASRLAAPPDSTYERQENAIGGAALARALNEQEGGS